MLIFEFLEEKIGLCGRKDLFFDLYHYLMEKQDSAEVKIFFLSLLIFSTLRTGGTKTFFWSSPIFSGFTIKSLWLFGNLTAVCLFFGVDRWHQ